MGNKESSSSTEYRQLCDGHGSAPAPRATKSSKMFHFALLGSESCDTSRILRDIQYECHISARHPDDSQYIVDIRKFAVESIWKLYSRSKIICARDAHAWRDGSLDIDTYSVEPAMVKLLHFALDRFSRSSWLKNKTSLQQLADCVQYLWRLPPIQECWRREYASDASMQHFLTHINRVMSERYQPTRRDVMCVPYASLSELSLCLNRTHINVVAIGGNKNFKPQYSRKVLHSLSEITGIIYVTSLSDFDVSRRSENGQRHNLLMQSIDAFGEITSDAVLHQIPVVLVLDQYDAFQRKIMTGNSSIRQIFNDFVGVADPHQNVQHSLDFIEQKFLEKMQASHSPQHRGLYVHVTSEYGTGMRDIAETFNNVQHMHVTKNLNSNGIF